MNREQVQRFYDTLAMLIGQREGVEITVILPFNNPPIHYAI